MRNLLLLLLLITLACYTTEVDALVVNKDYKPAYTREEMVVIGHTGISPLVSSQEVTYKERYRIEIQNPRNQNRIQRLCISKREWEQVVVGEVIYGDFVSPKEGRIHLRNCKVRMP